MEGMYIVLGGVGIIACCLYLWSAFLRKVGENGLKSIAFLLLCLSCEESSTFLTKPLFTGLYGPLCFP